MEQSKLKREGTAENPDTAQKAASRSQCEL